MVKKDLSQNLALFESYLTTICVLLNRVHPQSLKNTAFLAKILARISAFSPKCKTSGRYLELAFSFSEHHRSASEMDKIFS
jgi:hypothetical protein